MVFKPKYLVWLYLLNERFQRCLKAKSYQVVIVHSNKRKCREQYLLDELQGEIGNVGGLAPYISDSNVTSYVEGNDIYLI